MVSDQFRALVHRLHVKTIMRFKTYYINNRQIVKIIAYILPKFKIPGQVTNVITGYVIWPEIELDKSTYLY